MWVIHKSSPLSFERNVILTPSDAVFLRVGIQSGNNIHVWYRCDPSKPMVERTLLVIGTGLGLPESFEYIGTVDQVPYVWHIGEVRYPGGDHES